MRLQAALRPLLSSLLQPPLFFVSDDAKTKLPELQTDEPKPKQNFDENIREGKRRCNLFAAQQSRRSEA